MGIYEEKTFKKNKNGKWVLTNVKIVKAPHDVGRWARSAELDAKNNLGDYTSFQTDVTKSGINKKVTNIISYLGPNERVERNLITTSKNLSKKDMEKFRGVKGWNNPINRC